MNTKQGIFLASLFISLVLASCSFERLKEQEVSNKLALEALKLNVVGFDTVQQIVFSQGKCTTCHTPGHESGVFLTSYQHIIDDKLIIPGDSENSDIYKAVFTGFMPESGPLPAKTVEVLRRWIDDGGFEFSQ